MSYQNGKIYVIKSTVTNDTYVGSTIHPLNKRMSSHISTAKNPQERHYKLYECMNKLHIDNFYIGVV